MGKRGVAAAFVAAGLGLAGCAETNGSAETALAPAPLVAREGARLAAAPVALLTLQGAPGGRGATSRRRCKSACRARRGDGRRPEGDLSAARLSVGRPGEGGADLAYVFDVYDRHHDRAARLDASFTVKGEGDAWSLMNGATLDSLAAQSADDIAAWLSQTPEAAPATEPAQ